MNENLHYVIGIDLGTTYSAVAAWNKFTEQAEIIPNREDGNSPTTPSVVSLDPRLHNVIVGRAAKRNLAYEPQNTVIEIKREMGEVFSPETLTKFHANGIFRPQENGYEGDPVKMMFDKQWRLPQEISAFTLMKMKEIAEQEIGTEIYDAVITVPAYFTEKQKKATQEAALLAGLYPRQLIAEPTAAAICYGLDQMEPTEKIYLVYDLGGGTFDVSIISVEEQNIKVIATSGDRRLGGSDFDNAITTWAIGEMQQKYGLDVSNDPVAKAIIKLHAENLKIELSTFKSAKLTLLELNPHTPPILELTQERFEELIDPLLNKSLSYVDVAIKNAAAKKDVRREDINAILLVGGSSRIPKVKAKLLDYFQKDESFVRDNLDPDAVVARGAAILGLRFASSPAPFDITRLPDNAQLNTLVEQGFNLIHITEHSLGVGVQNNIFSKIIDQGTNIPISITNGGYVNAGPSEYVEVRVYQGEGQLIFDNTLIGVLQIGPLTPRPANEHHFEVTFSLDENGLLSMVVHHINEGRRYQARFDQKTGIGGARAMATIRNKLLEMYSPRTQTLTSAATYTGPGIYPGQVIPPAPADVSGGISPVAPANVMPSIPVAAAGSSVTSAPPYVTPAAEQPVASSAVSSAYAPVPGLAPQIVESTRDIPEQFKSIVRRAHKQLLKQNDADLLAAFNAFTMHLNAGKPEVDLTDLGDELEDVYQDSRRRTSH